MRSSVSNIEDSEKSLFWLDVLDELEAQQTQIVDELARTSWNHHTGELELDLHTRLMHDENLRGALRMLNVIKTLPEQLKNMIEEENQKRRKEEE